MVTIGSLRYDIIADATKFKEGVTASRRELTAAKKVFLETRTPAEKLSIEMEGLSRLFKKGGIDATTYGRALKKLKQQHDIASGGVKGLKSQVQAMPANIKSAASAYIGFGAVRSVFRSVREEMERMDEVTKQARKLGLSTEDLIGLRLAGAEYSGMEASGVDMALQRMTRRISEAAAGMGEAQGAIKELGLDAAALNEMGPAKAFETIAEAMSQVNSEQDQLRLAFKLFDSEGAGLVNTLKAGSAGIEDMHARAKELGMTFSEEDALGVEAANDALHEMDQSFRSIAQSLAVTFSPALEALADRLSAVTQKYREASAALGSKTEGIGQDKDTGFISKVVNWHLKGIDNAFGTNLVTKTVGNTPGTQATASQKAADQRAMEAAQQRQEQLNATREGTEAVMEVVNQMPEPVG